MTDTTRLTSTCLVLVALLFAPLAGGCGGVQAVGFSGGRPVTGIDDVQRAAPLPTPANDDDYLISTVEGELAAPPQKVFDYLLHAPLEDWLHGYGQVPTVTATNNLTPKWGYVGARRRVVFGDGGTALEELVASDAGKGFRYVVWNFTNDTGKAAAYAVGEFTLTPSATGTHLRWTYKFRSRGFPYTWFLAPVVRGDFHAFQQKAVQRVGERALVTDHGAEKSAP